MSKSCPGCIKIVAVVAFVIAAAGPVKADLVVNGNFATGDFTSWTLSGDTSSAYVSGSPGNYAAAFTTSTADGFLTQNLSTTPGQQYTASFLLTGDGASPNTFTASLGGTTLVSLSNVGNTLPSGTPYSFSYTASSTSSLLSFDVRDDPGYLYLTNVSVIAAAVPEPSAIVLAGLGMPMLMVQLWRKRRKSHRV